MRIRVYECVNSCYISHGLFTLLWRVCVNAYVNACVNAYELVYICVFTRVCPTLPYPTLPYPTLPYPTLPYPARVYNS